MSGYEQGRRFEWAVRDHMREQGFTVIRAASSKTKVDLVGVKTGELLFVQCKRTSPPGPAERRELVRLARCVGAVPLVALKPGRALELRELHGDGADPRDWTPYVLDRVAGDDTTPTPTTTTEGEPAR